MSASRDSSPQDQRNELTRLQHGPPSRWDTRSGHGSPHHVLDDGSTLVDATDEPEQSIHDIPWGAGPYPTRDRQSAADPEVGSEWISDTEEDGSTHRARTAPRDPQWQTPDDDGDVPAPEPASPSQSPRRSNRRNRTNRYSYSTVYTNRRSEIPSGDPYALDPEDETGQEADSPPRVPHQPQRTPHSTANANNDTQPGPGAEPTAARRTSVPAAAAPTDSRIDLTLPFPGTDATNVTIDISARNDVTISVVQRAIVSVSGAELQVVLRFENEDR